MNLCSGTARRYRAPWPPGPAEIRRMSCLFCKQGKQHGTHLLLVFVQHVQHSTVGQDSGPVCSKYSEQMQTRHCTCSWYSSSTSSTAACPYISARSRAVLSAPGSVTAGSACARENKHRHFGNRNGQVARIDTYLMPRHLEHPHAAACMRESPAAHTHPNTHPIGQQGRHHIVPAVHRSRHQRRGALACRKADQEAKREGYAVGCVWAAALRQTAMLEQ